MIKLPSSNCTHVLKCDVQWLCDYDPYPVINIFMIYIPHFFFWSWTNLTEIHVKENMKTCKLLNKNKITFSLCSYCLHECQGKHEMFGNLRHNQSEGGKGIIRKQIRNSLGFLLFYFVIRWGQVSKLYSSRRWQFQLLDDPWIPLSHMGSLCYRRELPHPLQACK